MRSIADSGTLPLVDEGLTYRGRRITAADLTWLRARIAADPGVSRRALSLAVCDAWQWRQPNGTPCDAICRGLLLWLHRGGHLVLPPPRWATRKPWRPRTSAPPVLIDTTPITGALRALQPLTIRQVRYQQPVGAHLKYVVFAADRPVACVTWASAPRHLGPRDRFIGWSPETRRQHLRFLAYNTRFLILPWVTVPHLASHVLGRLAAQLSADWQHVYGHPIYWLETFVDPARFRGTCYRAANWIPLGPTTGRGHNAPTKARTQPVKEVWGYPLTRRFRQQLVDG